MKTVEYTQASTMSESRFVCVTYIRASREELWSALTDVDTIPRWWFGVRCESVFRPGTSWRMIYPDGHVPDTGEVAEADPPTRLVIRWRNQDRFKDEGESLCSFELTASGATTKLTLTHSIQRAESDFIAAVSVAWPKCMSNLKSLLETGSIVLLAV